MATPSVLVIGTTFALPAPVHDGLRRAAGMVGRTLARAGLGLVTGNPPGVDRIAAAAFWAECLRLGRQPEPGYCQLWLPHWHRGYAFPGRGFAAPQECCQRLDSREAWIERAIDLAGAAVMVGGRRTGSLGIARRFIDAGKPVLPIPFVSGRSRDVFEEILRTWAEAPVPGVTQAQFLRLAVPWINETGPLANLLLGTLAQTQDIFISYRRSDSALAAGRLHADLVDHFGAKRVFFDQHGIVPSAQWLPTIERAIAACKVGVIVIGPDFLAAANGGPRRLDASDDVLREELTQLLAGRKRTILPVLVGGARLPTEDELPLPLKRLVEYQAPSLDNGNWVMSLRTMIAAIEAALAPGGAAPAR